MGVPISISSVKVPNSIQSSIASVLLAVAAGVRADKVGGILSNVSDILELDCDLGRRHFIEQRRRWARRALGWTMRSSENSAMRTPPPMSGT